MLSGRYTNQIEPGPDTAAHPYLQRGNPRIEYARSLKREHDEQDARRQWARQQMRPGATSQSLLGGGYQPGAGQAAIPRSPGFYAKRHNSHITSVTTAVPGSYLHVPPANSLGASSWSPGHPPGSYFSTPPRRDSNRPAPQYETPSRVDSSQPVSTDTLQVDNSGQSLGSSPTTQQADDAGQSMGVSLSTLTEHTYNTSQPQTILPSIETQEVDNTSQAQVALQPIQTQLMDNIGQHRTIVPSLQTQVVDNADKVQAALLTMQTQQMGSDSLPQDILPFTETQKVDNTGQPRAAPPSVQTQQVDNAGPSVTTFQPMPQMDDIDGL